MKYKENSMGMEFMREMMDSGRSSSALMVVGRDLVDSTLEKSIL